MGHNLLKGLLLIVLFCTISGCEEKDFTSTLAEDKEEVAALRNEIDKISNQVSCENAGDWKIAPIGSKACGGAGAFIPYSTKIDVNDFLKKVAMFTDKQKAFNVKWGSISDCSLITPPKSVECVGGKPKLVY